jgi:3-keto-L-gulonate-6-phosphate decarboxylase
VFTRETELWLQAVSRFNWARVLERLRTVCPELEAVADFVSCCADKLLSMCADPAAAMQTAVCASEAEARGAALEQCSSMLNRVLEEVYGRFEE